MLAKTMDIQEAQARFLDLVTLVASGTEVILTKNKKPFMRLVPMAGQTVTITAELPTGPALIEAEEHDTWSLLAQTGLNEAYSDHEPEYTVGMIKESNPVYEGPVYEGR